MYRKREREREKYYVSFVYMFVWLYALCLCCLCLSYVYIYIYIEREISYIIVCSFDPWTGRTRTCPAGRSRPPCPRVMFFLSAQTLENPSNMQNWVFECFPENEVMENKVRRAHKPQRGPSNRPSGSPSGASTPATESHQNTQNDLEIVEITLNEKKRKRNLSYLKVT